MKKSTWILIGVAAVIAIWAISGYNGLVNKDEDINGAASQLENTYTRRAELIEKLVATVKDYKEYEGDILLKVTEARSETQKVDLSNATPEQMKAFFEAQDALNEPTKALLKDLKVTVEAYPELKANEQYNKLFDELTGSDNRIAIARMDWINATKKYNASRRRFPNSIIASLFGFDARDYYEAPAENHANPSVILK